MKEKYSAEYDEYDRNRNMFYEIKIATKCNTNITYSVWWCDGMIKDGGYLAYLCLPSMCADLCVM